MSFAVKLDFEPVCLTRNAWWDTSKHDVAKRWGRVYTIRWVLTPSPRDREPRWRNTRRSPRAYTQLCVQVNLSLQFLP